MFTIENFDVAKRTLAEARRLHEVKAIRDKAEALRLYFKQQANWLLLQNQAAELKLRAERKAGGLLTEMEKAKGGGDGSNQYQKSNRSHDVTGSSPTLADIGITKMQSSRWQQVASIPKAVFEQFIKETKQAGEELTTRALLELRFASPSSAYSSAYGTMSPGTVHSPQEKLPHYVELRQGDALAVLKTFPDESVDCVVTSPPYYGLRDYRVEGQIGLEQTLEEYLEKMLAVTGELKRVLKKTGTMFWNHGDSYGSKPETGRILDSGGDDLFNRLRVRNNFSSQFKEEKSNGKQSIEDGINVSGRYRTSDIPKKSLLLQAHRLAIRMIDEQEWVLRNILIWHKPNCMPSSVDDRFTVDYEPLFFFSRSKKYFFEPQYEPHQDVAGIERFKGGGGISKPDYDERKWIENTDGLSRPPMTMKDREYNPLGRNKRCVWTIPTQPFADAHFAVYPTELCEIPIKAGCPEYICTKCGKAREKIYDVNYVSAGGRSQNENWAYSFQKMPLGRAMKITRNERFSDCGCNAEWRPGVVLDPFFGAGSTAIAASALGRSWIGIELSEKYIQIAKRRLMQHGIYPTPTENFCLEERKRKS